MMNVMAAIIREVEIIIAKTDSAICAIDFKFNLYKQEDITIR